MKSTNRFSTNHIVFIVLSLLWIGAGCEQKRQDRPDRMPDPVMKKEVSADSSKEDNTTAKAGDVQRSVTGSEREFAVINTGDTIWLNRLYPIQRDTAQYHRFGELVLKKRIINAQKQGGGYGPVVKDGYRYSEGWPGVLGKQNVMTNKTEELFYYNLTRTQVVKHKEIAKLNPYLKIHRNLEEAYPSFELYKRPSDSLLVWYRDQVPDEYLSFYHFSGVHGNGYACPIFSLVGIKDFHIQSWESTLVVLDAQGDILTTIREPNQITSPVVADDGRLVAYNYGNYLDNPHDDAPLGEVRIREVGSGALIYHQKDVGIGPRREIGDYASITEYVRLESTSKRDADFVILKFLNLLNRNIYTRQFTWEEFEHAKRTYGLTGYLLLHYDFNKSKF